LNSIHHLAESMSGKYSPRVAIVTGGSQGIGYSIVHRLADDGLDIAVNDIASKVGKIEEVVHQEKGKNMTYPYIAISNVTTLMKCKTLS